MTQEELKDLLLKDLCARLPYEVKCQIDYDNEEDAYLGIERYCDDIIVSVCIETEEIGLYEASEYFYPHEIKPYLRPMSNMTEEEINEFILISDTVLWLGNKRSTCILSLEQMDWLNKNMFDYRGLIPMGLALEAKEGMYKTK